MENPEVDKNTTAEQAVAQINNDLGVTYWPGAAGSAADLEELETGEPHPAWWHGDEDASSVFLREMGVVL